jgi:hypothetical protein
MTTERILSFAALLVVVGALLGVGTCVNRDWRFEDACRAAGGVVVSANKITAADRDSRKQACVTIEQPAIVKPIPLPAYAR